MLILGTMADGEPKLAPLAPKPQPLPQIEPLVGCATRTSFDLCLVNGEDSVTLTIAVRPLGDGEFAAATFDGPHELQPKQLARVRVHRPEAPVCEYRVRGATAQGRTSFEQVGKVRSPRAAGEPFQFSVFSDTHLHIEPVPYEDVPRAYPAWWPTTRDRVEKVARTVMQNIAKDAPDFAIGLGDFIDLHTLGFNVPFPNPQIAERSYLSLREVLSEWHGAMPFYAGLGNWDGENGEFPEVARAMARSVRVLALPNPDHQVYSQGGSEQQNYYAFEWGDVLFVVLDVMGPTKVRLSLDPHQDPALAAAWTLGEAQWRWLEPLLRESKAKDKMLFVHHTVGGNGGNVPNSVYGRGGGRAARVGEQARVHELMKATGARYFFYGHDHVFAHMDVDGIQYVCVSSAGAPWLFGKADTGYEREWKTPGHTRVAVGASQIKVSCTSIAGEVVHEFALPRGAK